MTTEKPTPKESDTEAKPVTEQPKEVGGFENKPEPTRYGDWDVGGRCSDF